MENEKKIIVWGTGNWASEMWPFYKQMAQSENIQIIGFIDNNPEKWGGTFKNLPVYSPNDLKKLKYDYISIWIKDETIYESIYLQLVKERGILAECIIDVFGDYKKKLLEAYKGCDDKETTDFIEKVISTRDIQVYYFDEAKKYESHEVFYDKDADLNYTLFEGKRLYLSRTFNRYVMRDGKRYVGDLYWEQDLNSPHIYESDNVFVKENSVVVDAGACEGNFSLHNIEKIRKLYLIECNEEWVEALKHTFKPYADRVVICNKFLTNYDSDTTIRLDSLVNEDIIFLKMDIEGAEIDALEGGTDILQNSKEVACSICSYHRHDDEKRLKEYLVARGFETEVSKGYMLYLYDKYVCENPELRRGIVRGCKRKGL